jgi:hypothetical protein
MGRTIPSFRIVFEIEKAEWKPFRNALDKSDRKKFDEMWDIPLWYVSACSNSVQYVRLHPILMSILLYDFKQLTDCISELERIEARVKDRSGKSSSKKGIGLTKKVQQVPTAMDSTIITTTTLDRWY